MKCGILHQLALLAVIRLGALRPRAVPAGTKPVDSGLSEDSDTSESSTRSGLRDRQGLLDRQSILSDQDAELDEALSGKEPTPHPTRHPTPHPTPDPTPQPTPHPTPHPTYYPTLFENQQNSPVVCKEVNETEDGAENFAALRLAKSSSFCKNFNELDDPVKQELADVFRDVRPLLCPKAPDDNGWNHMKCVHLWKLSKSRLFLDICYGHPYNKNAVKIFEAGGYDNVTTQAHETFESILRRDLGVGANLFADGKCQGRRFAVGMGDPHVTRLDGTRFELRKTGHHVLLRLPAHGVPQLLIRCTVHRYGEYCANTYITNITVKGLWTAGFPPLEFTAADSFRGHSSKSLIIMKDAVAFKVHGVGMQVFREKVHHLPYLNIRLHGVRPPAGGLLGQDDYAEVAAEQPGCRHGRPPARPRYS